MKLTQRIISLLLAVAMIFSIWGCGNPANETTTESTATETTTPTDTTEEAPSSPFTAGTYEASAFGFYPGLPVNVRVTVSDTTMESIEIFGDNMESPLMLRAVQELLIPRMIEHQTSFVDVVAGATMTSAAVRMAVTDCLEQAITDSALLDNFSDFPEYAVNDTAKLLETDILIVGLGGSGITAALSAAENGANVLAIDKAGKYGGTTCITSEMMAVNPEKFMTENNVTKDYVNEDEFLTDWLTRTHNDGKEEIIEMFIDQSGNTLDWLMYDHEWPFASPLPGHADYATYPVRFMYTPNEHYGNKEEIASYLDRLMKDYTEAGGEYLLEVEGYELMYDVASNTVTGVKAVGYDGQEYEIQAKAVVLATGGYGKNETMMEEYMTDEYFPLSGDWYMYGMTTNDGKLLESALNIGAGTYNPSIPPLSHLAGFPINLTGFETTVVE
ncbi:MAG: FAD-binding protein, partial [Lachnospiraceae bacterium]|nr:FAD-binding protein [Lachnospiraceae bacterium]